jgi:lipooligosaccharide transport system ATP-binding protein
VATRGERVNDRVAAVAEQPVPIAAAIVGNAVLRVQDLRKRYGDLEVVRGLTFAIRRGECFALLGPNGAGKTTTLRCCLGLIDPDGGSIELVGEPVPKAAREARIRVGVVPQMDNLDPDFTVRENLLIYGGYFRIRRSILDGRIPRLLEFAGLAGKAQTSIRTLSGGMKRRLTLARALINDPELLILDEPTTGLDPQARHLIWDGLRQLLKQGKTILLTTHFMDEAERLATRLAVIDHGTMIACDTPHALLERTSSPKSSRCTAKMRERGPQRAGAHCRIGWRSPARPPSATRTTPHRCSPISRHTPACATCTGRRISRISSSS